MPAAGGGGSHSGARQIINEGTSRAKVAALCGDPAQIDQKPVFYRATFPRPTGLVRHWMRLCSPGGSLDLQLGPMTG